MIKLKTNISKKEYKLNKQTRNVSQRLKFQSIVSKKVHGLHFGNTNQRSIESLGDRLNNQSTYQGSPGPFTTHQKYCKQTLGQTGKSHEAIFPNTTEICTFLKNIAIYYYHILIETFSFEKRSRNSTKMTF